MIYAMDNEQFLNFKQEMKEHTRLVVQESVKDVNLRLNQVSEKMESFMKRADPAVQTFENLTWLKKLLIGGLVFVSTIAGGLLAIKSLFNK